MTLGQRLRELRVAKPYERSRDLARHLGVDFTWWSKVEADRVRPDALTIRAVAGLLGADADELLALLDQWREAPRPDPSQASFVCVRRSR